VYHLDKVNHFICLASCVCRSSENSHITNVHASGHTSTMASYLIPLLLTMYITIALINALGKDLLVELVFSLSLPVPQIPLLPGPSFLTNLYTDMETLPPPPSPNPHPPKIPTHPPNDPLNHLRNPKVHLRTRRFRKMGTSKSSTR
jgi:hypothetical protein